MNENDHLRACDGIFQISHHLRHNGAKGQFLRLELKSVVLMVSAIGVAENDDSEACDNIFQTGHLMSRNLVM